MSAALKSFTCLQRPLICLHTSSRSDNFEHAASDDITIIYTALASAVLGGPMKGCNPFQSSSEGSKEELNIALARHESTMNHSHTLLNAAAKKKLATIEIAKEMTSKGMPVTFRTELLFDLPDTCPIAENLRYSNSCKALSDSGMEIWRQKNYLARHHALLSKYRRYATQARELKDMETAMNKAYNWTASSHEDNVFDGLVVKWEQEGYQPPKDTERIGFDLAMYADKANEVRNLVAQHSQGSYARFYDVPPAP